VQGTPYTKLGLTLELRAIGALSVSASNNVCSSDARELHECSHMIVLQNTSDITFSVPFKLLQAAHGPSLDVCKDKQGIAVFLLDFRGVQPHLNSGAFLNHLIGETSGGRPCIPASRLQGPANAHWHPRRLKSNVLLCFGNAAVSSIFR
jgi:hypothetical protein